MVQNKLLIHFIILSFVVLLLDAVFLGTMRTYFNNQIRTIQGTNLKMNLTAAILCYLVIIGCIYRFIILSNASIFEAAVLGWSIYLIYELTNKALFDKWSWTTVMIDGFWGGVLFAISTFLFRYIVKQIN